MTDDDIITAIEERRFALAKRELDRKLKSYPKKSFYKAIHCYYLLCMGQNANASSEASSLMKAIPSDIKTLKLLRDVLDKLGKQKEAVEIYENAARKYPSTELLESWYEESMALFDTELILKSSKAMYLFSKNSSKNIKTFAMSHLLAGPGKSKAEDIQLAIDALSAETSSKDTQGIYLQAKLHHQLSQFDKIIEVIDLFSQKNLELNLLYLEALKKTQRWQKLYDECFLLLFKQKFDDYDTWKLIIQSAFELGLAHEEIKILITDETRNSLLARIHLNTTYNLDTRNPIENYYEVFKTKPCCFLDLRAFKLSEKFTNLLEKNYEYLLNKTSLSELESAELVNLEMFISRMHRLTIDWKNFETKGESGFADLYPPFVVQSLQNDSSLPTIISHILKLEKLARLQPENAMLKSWLLNLYSEAGFSSLALKTYNDLKIKMVQHESLAYKLLLPPTLVNLKHLIDVYRFYLTSEAEVEHFYQKAQKMGLYTKIADIYSFGKTLANSLSKHLLVLQILRMCRVVQNENYSYFADIVSAKKWKIISDNFETVDKRDFTSDYNFRVETPKAAIYVAEKKQTREYVQINYAKELLLIVTNDEDVTKILKLFEKWLGQPSYRQSLSVSELHVFKLLLSIFKVSKGSKIKDREEQINFLSKNLELKKIDNALLAKINPLSKEMANAIYDLLDLERIGCQLISKETRLAPVLFKYRDDLKKFLAADPRLNHFKELKKLLCDNGSYNKDQLDFLEESLL